MRGEYTYVWGLWGLTRLAFHLRGCCYSCTRIIILAGQMKERGILKIHVYLPSCRERRLILMFVCQSGQKKIHL